MTQTIDDVYATALRLVRVHRLTHDLDPRDQEDIAHDAPTSYLEAFAGDAAVAATTRSDQQLRTRTAG